MELQNIMDDMVCWSMIHTEMCGYLIHCYAAIFLHGGFNYCNGLWCHYSVCLSRGESVTELIPFMNFLVHSYTCCSDRHASQYFTFIRRWISTGFPLHYLKNGWQNAVLLWCMLQAGPPSLHYYCAVVLHSCIDLSATLQTTSINVVNLQDNRAVFRIFIAFLKFSFDSPSYKLLLS